MNRIYSTNETNLTVKYPFLKSLYDIVHDHKDIDVQNKFYAIFLRRSKSERLTD